MKHEIRACAVVVLYFPSDTDLACLESIQREFERVFIIDNSPVGGRRGIGQSISGESIHREGNIGLSEAYNRAARVALDEGFSWMVTFDQDTLVSNGFGSLLTRSIGDGCARGALGAVGASFVNAKDLDVFVAGAEEVVEVEHVISSGCAVSLSAWEEVGGFDDRLFIDLVDLEFCWRLRDHGYRILQMREMPMSHGMGDPGVNYLFGFGRRTSNYGALRHYYIARNLLIIRRFDDARWRRLALQRIKFVLLSLLFEPNRPKKMTAIALGVADAVRGVSGGVTEKTSRRIRD